MSIGYYDNRLRPAVEAVPATLFSVSAFALWMHPSSFFPMLPALSEAAAVALGVLAVIRTLQAARIVRYRHQLRRLPRYTLPAGKIPVSNKKLFLGRGFKWDQRHVQRLVEARHPSARKYMQQGPFYRLARHFEIRYEKTWGIQWLIKLTSADKWWNPVRPLPPVGGDAALHGVGMEDEHDVYADLLERVGHLLVLGTTRVGKTRAAEIMISQDIRRGEIVIVLDPKGDVGLLMRMYAEAKRAGRLSEFHVFHLSFAEISERYNPVGEFRRVTEPASRTAQQLPSEGNSAAFREFAWRFSNVVNRALVGLGRKPSYQETARYVTNIEPLLIEYYHLWLEREGPEDWKQAVALIESQIDPRSLSTALKGRDYHAIALTKFVRERGLYDPVADGLRSAFEYDKTYFDKLTASLLPLLEKLTTGEIGGLLSPNYDDPNDHRPVLDWRRVVREGGIVYFGLAALTDAEVSSAVAAAAFSDLTSVAGELYDLGDTHGLPDIEGHKRKKIALHGDELNELLGDDFIPMVNKAGGAGVQVTGYTQTSSDVEAGIGSQAKSGQVFGNFNSLMMFRVIDEPTAKVLTTKLSKVRVYTKITESRVTDDNNPDTKIDFVSANADRHSETEVDPITPGDLVRLPKGQCFALLEGGQLYKLRLPLPDENDPFLPKDREEIWQHLRDKYHAKAAMM